MEQQIKQAQATGDIATLLRLMGNTTELTPADFIKKTVGSLLYVYYAYVDRFNQRPKDCEDLVDGLLYIETQQFLEKKAYKDMQARMQNERRQTT